MVNKSSAENYRCPDCPFHATCSRTSSFWSTATPTPRPLRAEGTIATRLMIAIIQKMVCIGAMKRSTLGVAPDGSCNPANIACKTLIGMLVARTANEIERLRRAPVVTRVADIPEATPRLVTGAELMIELMLGATNIPPPAPTRTMRNARTVYDTLAGMSARPIRPAVEIVRPVVVKNRGPYLSER